MFVAYGVKQTETWQICCASNVTENYNGHALIRSLFSKPFLLTKLTLYGNKACDNQAYVKELLPMKSGCVMVSLRLCLVQKDVCGQTKRTTVDWNKNLCSVCVRGCIFPYHMLACIICVVSSLQFLFSLSDSKAEQPIRVLYHDGRCQFHMLNWAISHAETLIHSSQASSSAF